MSLNLIHRIFGKTSSLQRSDIEAYGKSDDALLKNAVEQKAAAHPFDADAMEGWESMGYNLGAMGELDKQFAPKSYTSWYIGGGLVAVAGIAVLTYMLWSENDLDSPTSDLYSANVSDTTQDEIAITLDEADVIISTQIEEMDAAPSTKQLQPAVIKQDFQDIEANHRKDPPLAVAQLPILELNTNKQRDLEIIRKHEKAKEIYLHDFKLIDYRNYRSKPQIKTRQMTLTGLPASFEDSIQEDVDPSWQDVNIPYIDFIDKSMRIFGQGNYKRALSRFETVLESYELDVNAHFYAGLCLFNLGEYEKALFHFESCITGPYSNFDEEALWMNGLCLEHSGERTKARKIFEQISKQGSHYSDQAAKKLR